MSKHQAPAKKSSPKENHDNKLFIQTLAETIAGDFEHEPSVLEGNLKICEGADGVYLVLCLIEHYQRQGRPDLSKKIVETIHGLV